MNPRRPTVGVAIAMLVTWHGRHDGSYTSRGQGRFMTSRYRAIKQGINVGRRCNWQMTTNSATPRNVISNKSDVSMPLFRIRYCVDNVPCCITMLSYNWSVAGTLSPRLKTAKHRANIRRFRHQCSSIIPMISRQETIIILEMEHDYHRPLVDVIGWFRCFHYINSRQQ